ncbi:MULTISPECIES: hypothetical protein [unclassified Streptomyces]|uniref:hypothetical protein n=1 Tax=unclassified Streptomyces TaxID=2593676 RepID=UPI000370D925|nr:MULTISPECIES: hypothetical protein [unclassified Streptomyces]MYS37203.1 hypothetical protein [Streptomyces sp. SID4920]MYX68628.1 hypothetical protein [Streptomyces sp. SID8373]
MRHNRISRQATRRCLYTGESYHQALGAQQDAHATIPAATGHQQFLEARVFEAVVDSGRNFYEHPFGVRRVLPQPATITLHLETTERAVHLLRYVLPSYSEEYGHNGLRGVWIRHRTLQGIEIAGAHGQASVWLTGLSSSDWTRAERTIAEEQADEGLHSLWQDPPSEHATGEDHQDTAEAARARRWDNYLNRGAWCASGLLRRIAIFHTVTTADLVTGIRALPGIIGYEGLGPVRWAFDIDRRPGLPDSQHALIQALTDPGFGLPIQEVPFGIPFFDNSARHTRIGDDTATALIELRSSEITYPSLDGRPAWGDPARFVELGRAIRRRVARNLASPPYRASS